MNVWADFTGPYEMQNWSNSGIKQGTTSISPPSGPAASAEFSYDVQLEKPATNGVTYRTATFSATAAGTEYVSFDWTYTFFHSWYDVEADFYVFADGPSGTTFIHEVDFYNLMYTGERTFSGSSTIWVEEGYEFGFIIGGSNYDRTGTLCGTLTVSNLATMIDIKPGSDPNSINLKSKGKVPVAILSSEVFDATTVDPSTVKLADAQVAVKGKKGKLMASVEDVNGDGLDDLVLHFNTQELNLTKDSTEAVLIGETFDGMSIIGSDSVNIVPKR